MLHALWKYETINCSDYQNLGFTLSNKGKYIEGNNRDLLKFLDHVPD